MENYEFKAKAREILRGNWKNPVLVTLIFILMYVAVDMIPNISFVFALLIGGPMMYGLNLFFLSFIERKEPQIETLFDGFKIFKESFVLGLLMAIFTMLWTLLLIIPGIIAALSYSMSYFIMRDNPKMSASDAIKKSKEMMYGHKWKFFCLNLSFIGWYLLGILTLGIGWLWVESYRMTSVALFYEDLKKSSAVKKKTVKRNKKK